MSIARRFEMISGWITLIVGLLTLIYVLFIGQLYRFISSTGESGTASLFEVGIQPITLAFFSLFLLALIAVTLGATRHSRTEANRWRIALWIGTIVITIFTILALASVGQLFIPVTLCAIFTSAFALAETNRPNLV